MSAHGLAPSLRADPSALPGSFKYVFERPAEWIDVNLLTFSTKQKQLKKTQLASERVAEMGTLLYTANPKEKRLRTALVRYRYYLESAEDMAEKIIFLDGAEIGVAEAFEEETRLQEKSLRELLEGSSAVELAAVLNEALILARNQNKKIFEFMVNNYQGTDAEVRKHQDILGKHIALTRDSLLHAEDDKKKKAAEQLAEAEKFRKAGLNIQAYDWIEKAKNTLY